MRHWLQALLVVLALNAAAAHADNIAATPDGLIKAVVGEVMTAVKTDKDMQGGSIPKITAMVEKKVLPYTNFERTTQLAMGRNWPKATPQQRAQIVDEFKQLLIRTYAGAIAQIRDQTVDFKPLRAAADDREVVVRTVVINRGEPIQLDYRLEKNDSAWRVYDINVLGAWLSEAYRNQFADQINQKGVDGLVQFLHERNQQLASGKAR